MKLRSIKYYLKDAIISLLKNRLMTLASIITVASCMIIVSISFCIAVNLDYILKQIENKTEIVLYIDDDLDAIKVNTLLDTVKAIPNVSRVNYISKEQALKDFSKSLGENNSLVKGLENDNPLPRSIVVNISDAVYQAEVVTTLKTLKKDGVFEVIYQKELIDTLTTISHALRFISAIIIAGFLSISIVLIMNTIKLTVNYRRVEINIMKYVGATDWFIRWPFIIEGVLIGILGSILPLVFSWITYSNSITYLTTNNLLLQDSLEFHSIKTIFSFLIPFTLFLGVFIGVVGSITSIKKHMEV